MAREAYQSLTEQMYYILLALLEPRCGVDISRRVSEISGQRIQIGPGTLYTLLAKFEKEGIIRETGTEGRKRYYQVTAHGYDMLLEEYRRLERLVTEGSFLENLRGGGEI